MAKGGRRLALGLACAAIVSACGGGAAPLAVDVAQKGMVACVPVPRPGMPGTSWHTPIGFALDNFVNESRAPLTVESVKLIDAHNVIFHGAFVYEMVHSLHPLGQAGALAELRASVPAAAWSRVQAVPGALIRAGHPVANFIPSYSLNIWQIVPEVSEKTPAGGWALGEVVTYRANGQTYTVTAYTGYAIAPDSNACDPLINAAWAAFRRT